MAGVQAAAGVVVFWLSSDSGGHHNLLPDGLAVDIWYVHLFADIPAQGRAQKLKIGFVMQITE